MLYTTTTLCACARASTCSSPERTQVMPPGLNIFDDGFMKANYDRYHDKLRVVHNNWIIGHDAKRDRFRQADLWKVDDWDLPNCERRTF